MQLVHRRGLPAAGVAAPPFLPVGTWVQLGHFNYLRSFHSVSIEILFLFLKTLLQCLMIQAHRVSRRYRCPEARLLMLYNPHILTLTGYLLSLCTTGVLVFSLETVRILVGHMLNRMEMLGLFSVNVMYSANVLLGDQVDRFCSMLFSPN